jgi:hypothetical protein
MFETADDFDYFIDQHRFALRVYLIFSSLVVALGVMLVLSSFVAPPSTAGADFLMRVGGVFVAAVSTFPLNQYLERRDRLSGVRKLKATWESVTSRTDLPPNELAAFKASLTDTYMKWVAG